MVKNLVSLLFIEWCNYAYLLKITSPRTSPKQRRLQRLAALHLPVLAPQATQKGSEHNFVMALQAPNRRSSWILIWPHLLYLIPFASTLGPPTTNRIEPTYFAYLIASPAILYGLAARLMPGKSTTAAPETSFPLLTLSLSKVWTVPQAQVRSGQPQLRANSMQGAALACRMSQKCLLGSLHTLHIK